MLYRIHPTWVIFELTTLVVIGSNCICSCKSNYQLRPWQPPWLGVHCLSNHHGFGICCWYTRHCLSVIMALEYVVDICVIVYLSSWLWNMLLIYASLSICHHVFGICCWYMCNSYSKATMTDRQWRVYQQHIPKPWWQRQWHIYQQHIPKPWWQIDNDAYINVVVICVIVSVIMALEYVVDIRVIVYLSSWLWNMLLIYVSLSLSSWLWNMLLIYALLSICHRGFGICCWYMRHCLSVIMALEYVVDICVIVYLSSWLWNMLLIYASLSIFDDR
jgi:hypothetical protein